MHILRFLILSLFASVSCCTQQSPELDKNEIYWADEQIDSQRMLKRRLLTADPIERGIEQQLLDDHRVQTARFAIQINTWLQTFGFSDDQPYTFICVMNLAESSSPQDATQILNDALEVSDMTIVNSSEFNDANTWAIRGSMIPCGLDNPDLSVLHK